MDNELDPRLQQMLNSYGATPERDPNAARRTQARFMELLNVMFEEQVAANPAPARTTWFSQLQEALATQRRSLLFGFAALAILALFLFGGMGITAYAASSSLPGDALYPLKTTVENVRAGWTPNTASKARLYMAFAGRRLSEIQLLMDQSRYDDIPRAANEFERDIQRAMNATERLSQTNPDRTRELNAELAVALRVYGDILKAWVASTPGDSGPALQSAVDVSQAAADLLGAGQDDGTNRDGTLDDDDDQSPSSPVPSQTPLVISTPTVLANTGQTPQATLTPEPLATVIQPPPATSTSVPVVVPTNTNAGSSSAGLGADGTCQGSVGAVTVENLEVPQGASCTLDGTRVQGNIFVRNGASLTAQRVTVIGNIQAEGANFTGVYSSTVGGSIQIKQGGSASIEGVSVIGDIQFESNYGVLSASGNQVGGNIQVFKNSAGITISNNSVNGNLQCKENNSAPTGGNNTVQGNKEDQCAGL